MIEDMEQAVAVQRRRLSFDPPRTVITTKTRTHVDMQEVDGETKLTTRTTEEKHSARRRYVAPAVRRFLKRNNMESSDLWRELRA